MSYSNDQTQIKSGLINYIGAMLKSSKFENEKATRHSVVAILLGEAMKLCKDDQGMYDIYVSKPALRLTSSIAKQRANLMKDLPQTKEIASQLNDYKQISQALDKIIDNTKL